MLQESTRPECFTVALLVDYQSFSVARRLFEGKALEGSGCCAVHKLCCLGDHQFLHIAVRG